MNRLIDLSGQKFGRLTVISKSGSDSNGHAMWVCRCDCGNEIITRGYALRAEITKSCGCYNCDAKNEIHHGSRTRLYRIWIGMKERCYNKRHKGYKYYGDLGVTVCQEWLNNFAEFQEWAYSHGYREYLTIDRIDNDKGYSPDNCRWATYSEQNRNQRKRKKTAGAATPTDFEAEQKSHEPLSSASSVPENKEESQV